MTDEKALARLHYELIHGLVERCACPTNSELAGELGIEIDAVEQLLRDLAGIHGIVLHPNVCEPWIVHPFSLTPTIHWVEGRGRSWWAPCMWCAFGVANLVGGTTRIHTRIGAEAEPMLIDVDNGEPVGSEDLWVHFAIPPARAWDNVHQHCSMVLPFRTKEAIQDWCGRHSVDHGQDVPLRQVAHFARRWYGGHGSPTWRKWTVAEAQDIFHQSGLTSDFWNLGVCDGKY